METKITGIQLLKLPESVQKQRKATHSVILSTQNFDAQTQKLLISVDNKISEINPKTKEAEITIKEKPKNEFQTALASADAYRVKGHIVDPETSKISGSVLQEFHSQTQGFQHTKADELHKTSDVILGEYSDILERWSKEVNRKSIVLSDIEPWKDFDIYNQYIGYLCYGINAKKDNNSNTFLTGFSAAIRYEAYNIGDNDEYSLYNWMYLLNGWMDNRGEMVDAKMDLFIYRCNVQSGMNREILKEKTGKIPKAVIIKKIWKSLSKGKKLHDEIFFNKKINLLNNVRSIDFEGDTSLKNFYNRTAAYLREASIFNRTSDISYSFAIANKDDDNLLATIAGKSAAHDYPYLTEIIKNKKFGIFKEMQGIFGYIADDILGAISSAQKMINYRGPFLLEPIIIERNNAGNIQNFIDENPDAILYDLQLLNKINLKP